MRVRTAPLFVPLFHGDRELLHGYCSSTSTARSAPVWRRAERRRFMSGIEGRGWKVPDVHCSSRVPVSSCCTSRLRGGPGRQTVIRLLGVNYTGGIASSKSCHLLINMSSHGFKKAVSLAIWRTILNATS